MVVIEDIIIYIFYKQQILELDGTKEEVWLDTEAEVYGNSDK